MVNVSNSKHYHAQEESEKGQDYPGYCVVNRKKLASGKEPNRNRAQNTPGCHVFLRGFVF